MLYLILTNLFYSKCNHIEGGEGAGHGGISHGDMGCPGYDVNGGMGGAFNHHRGPGVHSGDTGKNGIVFTKDVLHHNDGEIYVSEPVSGDFADLNDLHNKLMDRIKNLHDATIQRKEAEKEQARLEEEIANEKIKKAQEEVERLKQLDDQAAINEHKKPEVLGKQVIPVVNFTSENIPLIHHVRLIIKKLAAIQENEMKTIEAQKRIARLEDITDRLDTGNFIYDTEEYKKFLDAASLGNPIYFPVYDNGGKFYIGNSFEDQDLNTDMAHDPVSGGSFRSPDGHSHFVDHGDTSGPNRGGFGNGEGPRIRSPISGDSSRYYNYPKY